MFVGGLGFGVSSSWGEEVLSGEILHALGLLIVTTCPCVCSRLWCFVTIC
jgi:hypothetical protein